MIKIICEQCNKEFESYPSLKRKVCSNLCRYNLQRGRKRISKRIGWNLSLIHNQRKGKTYEELYGKEKAKEIRDRLKKSQNEVNRNGEKNGFFGKVHTQKVCKIISEAQSKIWKIRWQDKTFRENNIKKILKALLKRPTSFEQRFIKFFDKYNLDFEYVGDGEFFINGLNPDFVNKEKKIVLEVFYSWFKIRNYGSVNNYINSWSKKYDDAGWKALFISEEVVNNKDFDKRVGILLKPYLEQQKIQNYEKEHIKTDTEF